MTIDNIFNAFPKAAGLAPCNNSVGKPVLIGRTVNK